MLEIGSVIDGKYKILNKIGQGGMSVVYLAMNEKANKQWAIKEVRKDGTTNFEVVKQGLIAETDILKKLNHPNLPSIIDVIDNDDTFLIVMDYIEGNSLDKRIKEYGAQPQEEVIEWAKQLCDVLDYLHTRVPPIIYRDLKPANIMLKPDNKISIIDFGTAREYKGGKDGDTENLGTREYAAPEQFGGQGETDGRTDIYCLGTTLYHLVTGHSPLEPPLYAMQPIRYWNPALSSGLEEIIFKCTAKDKEDRYQNCKEVRYALEHYEFLDIEYKKKQRFKLGTFITTLVITIILFITSAVFHSKENSLRSANYDNYVRNAGTKNTYDEVVESYQKAISLSPTREEAYIQMLDYMLEDDVFTDEESKTMIAVLNSTSGSNYTFEEIFTTNAAGYAEFAYNMAVAYWYNYGSSRDNISGQRSMASRWFKKVNYVENYKGRANNLVEYDNAVIYSKIGEYYDRLGRVNNMGDSSISYIDYWNDLMELYNSESANQVTRLYLENEILLEIHDHLTNFKSDGLTKEQVVTVIDSIENEVNKIIPDDKNKELYNSLILKAQNYIERARTTVIATYDQQG